MKFGRIIVIKDCFNSDHFAIYVAGGVLSAGAGGSFYTTLSNYLSKNNNAIYGVYDIAEDLH